MRSPAGELEEIETADTEPPPPPEPLPTDEPASARSVADAQEPDALVAKHLLSGESNEATIQIIKSGVIQKMNNTGAQQAQ